MKVICKFLMNVLLSIDQLGNTLLLGDPDETISSRIGKYKLSCGGKITWKNPIIKMVDLCLDKIDPGHSIDAIEPYAGEKAIIKNPEWRLKNEETICDEKGEE